MWHTPLSPIPNNPELCSCPKIPNLTTTATSVLLYKVRLTGRRDTTLGVPGASFSYLAAEERDPCCLSAALYCVSCVCLLEWLTVPVLEHLPDCRLLEGKADELIQSPFPSRPWTGFAPCEQPL